MKRTILGSAAAAALLAAWTAVGGCGPGTEGGENHPPKLTLDVGSEAQFVAGDFVRIRASATDPDGDALQFRVDNKPERAEFQSFDQEALLTWRPIPSDVTDGDPLRLTFIVEDARGAVADAVVRLHIRAGNGLPQFQNSSSKLHDVTSNRPVQFAVEVRDDDSQRVELRMPSDRAPEGANFEQTGPKKGTFEWDPSAKQKNVRVHSATFVADDMENEPVEQTVTIIFKDGDGGSGGGVPAPGEACDEERPIDFDPLPAQHTLEDYPIEATFSDSAANTYEVASVLWTTEDPFNDPDVEFDAADLEVDGTDISGAIPNLVLSPGESETVFYAVCALDRDAPDDADDKVVCSPERLFHSFLAYSPDDTDCIDDDSSDSASAFSETDWRHYRACSGAKDVHEFEVAAEEKVTAFVTFPFGQSISLNVVDAAGAKHNDALRFSDCLGVAAVQIEHDASESKATYSVEVTGSDLPYQTRLTRETTCRSEDAFTGNHTRAQAALPETKTYDNLKVCGGEPDWYERTVFDGQKLTAILEAQSGASLSDVSLAIYDENGNQVRDAAISGSALEVDYTGQISPKAQYFIRVSSPDDLVYSLEIRQQ